MAAGRLQIGSGEESCRRDTDAGWRTLMTLPFSREAFLDVFGIYNTSFWPVALVLWLATLVAFGLRLLNRDRSQWTWGLIALQWVWSAFAYHARLFTAINPAAWVFMLLFLMQAGALFLFGVVEDRLRFRVRRDAASFVGFAFIAYSAAYPFIALAGADTYPRVPTFGVPCPTTIVTVGFLMLVSPTFPRLLAVVPVLWAVIGGSAALLLGMHADLALPIAALALIGRLGGRI